MTRSPPVPEQDQQVREPDRAVAVEIGLPFRIEPAAEQGVCDDAREIVAWCLPATDADLGNPRDGNPMVQRFT